MPGTSVTDIIRWGHTWCWLVMMIGLLPSPSRAQTFQNASFLLNAQPTQRLLAGASTIDFNNDGLMDLYHPGTLYLQRFNGAFREVLGPFGIGREGADVVGGVFGDVNNDGYLDAFFNDQARPSSFWLSSSGNLFFPANRSTGLQPVSLTQGTAWGDYDNNGYLDLFVASSSDELNELFLNNGDQTFRDVSTSAGIQHIGFSTGVATSDYDRDGDLDIYVARFDPADPGNSLNLLLQNNGDGTFIDVAPTVAVQNSLPGRGVVWFDYDNDGWMDLYITNQSDMIPRPGANALFRNTGTGGFENVATAAGVNNFSMGYGAAAADFDNDGWMDLYVTNLDAPPLLYHNNGDGTFTDIYASTGIANPSDPALTGFSVADINGDGWLDLFQPSSPTKQAHLFFNEGGPHHWLRVQLVGQSANNPSATDVVNRNGIGARIEVVTPEGRQTREITTGSGLGMQHDNLVAHFGLGTASQADSLIIYWPGGDVDRLSNIEPDRQITVVRNEGVNQPPSRVDLLAPLDGTDLLPVNGLVTFSWTQALDPEDDALTYQLHLVGPGLDTLFTDITTQQFDVVDDLFEPEVRYAWTVISSDGHSLRNSSDRFSMGGSPAATVPEPLNIPFQIEPLELGTGDFGDYDNDGDLDLLLTGRTDNNRPITKIYRLDDSLFTITQGAFEFQETFKVYHQAEQSIFKQLTRSSVHWGDYNGDDFLDVLATGLNLVITPTEQFLVPTTEIYENQNGNIVLSDISNLTDVHSGYADWGDYDNDGDMDLLLCGATQADPPYLPITRIFRNDEGSFTEQDLGLPGIMAGRVYWIDFDNDDNLDIALSGVSDNNTYITRLFRNDGPSLFTDVEADLPDLAFGSLDWGDYDDDGDPDLLIVGGATAPELVEGFAAVYRNDGNGLFSDIGLEIVPALFGQGTWGDYDNDGDLDLFIVGAESVYGPSDGWIYRNDDGAFLRELRIGGATFGDLLVGDYNQDGDLDYVSFGRGPDNKIFMGFFVNRIFPDPIPPGLLTRN